MNKFLSLTLAAVLLVGTLASCTQAPAEPTAKTPEELTESYKTAIDDARTEDDKTYVPLMTTKDDPNADLLFQLLGVTADDLTAFAIGLSPMNVQAYGVVALMPAADKSDAVLEAVKGFVERQKANFDMYLMDQYEIASAAKVETLADGTILLVMCEGQDEVSTAIKENLSK